MLQLFLVLRIAVANHTDGGNAHPQQIGIALSGVALEVTVQHAFTLGHRQLVIRTGKVIHTDKLIARLRQEGDGFLQDIEFLLRTRQVSIFDFALSSKNGRQMRVVKDTQTIGVQLRHAFQGKSETLRRLFRQAVNQVDVGGGKANLTRMVKQCQDEFFILLAVNQTLHFFVEVLHAHTQTIKALGA